MKKELNTTEQHFATTRSEAERIVEQARDEEKQLNITKIDSKTNKYGEYFVVTLKFTYNTPKDIMAYE